MAFAALALFLVPAIASASSSAALREYNAGKYDQALKDYEKLLEKSKNPDPRLHFNAGAAAYQNKSFEEARKQFNQALNSPDLQLVGKAYYNRGNTLYQLGAANPEAEERKKMWEEALKDFDSTMQLNRQDLDAKNNYDFVKQQLEELKKQQQQQQNQQDQNKDDKQNQDQKQQQDKDQQQKDQQARNQQQQQQDKSSQQQNKDQQDQKNQQQAKNDNKNKGEQQQKQDQASANEKKKQDDQKADQKKQQQQANASKEKQGQPGEKGEEGQTYAVGQMTPQQAQQLLDAQKNEEMLLPVKPDGKPRESRGPVKDW